MQSLFEKWLRYYTSVLGRMECPFEKFTCLGHDYKKPVIETKESPMKSTYLVIRLPDTTTDSSEYSKSVKQKDASQLRQGWQIIILKHFTVLQERLNAWM